MAGFWVLQGEAEVGGATPANRLKFELRHGSQRVTIGLACDVGRKGVKGDGARWGEQDLGLGVT